MSIRVQPGHQYRYGDENSGTATVITNKSSLTNTNNRKGLSNSTNNNTAPLKPQSIQSSSQPIRRALGDITNKSTTIINNNNNNQLL